MLWGKSLREKWRVQEKGLYSRSSSCLCMSWHSCNLEDSHMIRMVFFCHYINLIATPHVFLHYQFVKIDHVDLSHKQSNSSKGIVGNFDNYNLSDQAAVGHENKLVLGHLFFIDEAKRQSKNLSHYVNTNKTYIASSTLSSLQRRRSSVGI